MALEAKIQAVEPRLLALGIDVSPLEQRRTLAMGRFHPPLPVYKDVRQDTTSRVLFVAFSQLLSLPRKFLRSIEMSFVVDMPMTTIQALQPLQ